ncbi:DUF4442 domain-containing protein [Sphingobacterium olei]|uniref:DUF4442 domain-containing protein n=1 Tax=Sphingobacterium olei TaxID=2571155 RepID=A0A4U0P8G8_9SPHI|nr:hotdog fold domain-containing protein [Sphingobacterium olei]TJZ63092.1 DUF4442 domain-containing protein [Sphingobacterium olei]
MKFSPTSLKWILRTYPPFLFQRIWIKKVEEGFRGIEVKIYKSFLNINSNRTVFGGTIFSALDPLYPILLDQIFQANGLKKTVAWLKSAKIEYRKPGKMNLGFSVRLADSDIKEAFTTIRNCGKVVKTFKTNVYDTDGTLIAISYNEIYIRDLTFPIPKRNVYQPQLEDN